MAEGVGHGGGDMLQMMDFVAAIRGGSEPPIGVHEAMDMTLPGLLSQQSIREGGRWLGRPRFEGVVGGLWACRPGTYREQAIRVRPARPSQQALGIIF